MSIPLIGTAVVNSSFWVTRLLMSVDYPVDEFVIINNNGRGELDNDLDKLKSIDHKFVKKITVCHMPRNIGVSGAWNLIIKCYMNCPYWIIVNDDVSFGLGLLEEMYNHSQDNEIGLVHGNPGDFNVGSWDLFLIKDWVVKTYGLFDENLYPAYCEDADYIMRFVHRPIKKVLSLESNYYHGLGNKDEYYTHGSQTSKTDPLIKNRLDEINIENFSYMFEKWGEGWRYCSPSEHPYGKEDIPITYTSYDLDYVRSKNLGF